MIKTKVAERKACGRKSNSCAQIASLLAERHREKKQNDSIERIRSKLKFGGKSIKKQ